ncbi:hypothetical protein CFC21_022511 [Triticum aestivum]|uniref:Zinc finger GRF-type domain-containing protein n=2 Tax=Triticum aestivum TaxID=4565 RepID=A0A3B6C2K7_WHEAT|nr:uncharacterized protein LOC123040997 [Triticum aestivum]KAF7007583.1 hypothetical protein CFC21_022511 [Triticum aestivum]
MSSSHRSHLTCRPTADTATSARRPGSALAQQLVGEPLPIIKCDHCWRLVVRHVSSMPKHPRWVYFKCEKDGDGCKFWYWEEEYIDLLIARNLLDVGALVARDEAREDAMFKFEEEEKKEVCKLKPVGKRNNVVNQEMEKALIGLTGAVKEVVFLLKCVFFLVVFFGLVLLVKNWWSM